MPPATLFQLILYIFCYLFPILLGNALKMHPADISLWFRMPNIRLAVYYNSGAFNRFVFNFNFKICFWQHLNRWIDHYAFLADINTPDLKRLSIVTDNCNQSSETFFQAKKFSLSSPCFKPNTPNYRYKTCFLHLLICL